jgi:hypothetical protein
MMLFLFGFFLGVFAGMLCSYFLKELEEDRKELKIRMIEEEIKTAREKEQLL